MSVKFYFIFVQIVYPDVIHKLHIIAHLYICVDLHIKNRHVQNRHTEELDAYEKDIPYRISYTDLHLSGQK